MKNYKVIKVSVLMFFLLFIISSECFALGDWLNEAEEFIEYGNSEASRGYTLDTDLITNGSAIIFNAFLAIGTVVAIIVGAIMGIQFMTAGIDEKVKVKQALYPYLISCIVLFGSYGIWRLVVIIMNDI